MKKKIYLTLIFIFSVAFAMAQNIKPYLATVKTKAGITKGVLFRVDSASLTIAGSDKMVTIKMEDIKTIKVRSPKKDHDLIQFISYDPWSADNFDQHPGGFKVRKWGAKDPGLGEEIGGHVVATVINVTGNILAAPIQAINPSIANFKIKGSSEKYAELRDELTYYSVYYQANPDQVAELKKIKALSTNFKP